MSTSVVGRTKIEVFTEFYELTGDIDVKYQQK